MNKTNWSNGKLARSPSPAIPVQLSMTESHDGRRVSNVAFPGMLLRPSAGCRDLSVRLEHEPGHKPVPHSGEDIFVMSPKHHNWDEPVKRS